MGFDPILSDPEPMYDFAKEDKVYPQWLIVYAGSHVLGRDASTIDTPMRIACFRSIFRTSGMEVQIFCVVQDPVSDRVMAFEKFLGDVIRHRETVRS
jgi:ribosome-associated toxin RatA of RatAB toxin-antitoxin module